ncbi:MAG: dethiobiotin synthase [Reichenbachiella sp.]|uniref:dethiobiotin synthase n=1 Tax=Reichenbachiella sp. TaxID=2184521 RepID=UPI0032630EF7
MKKYFVTGIDTDSGKTVASAILVEKLQADYWKPIQAGAPTDSDTIRSLVKGERKIHPEGIVLKAPMSPHAAAKLENINLNLTDIKMPSAEKTLVIEGAGGLMVPINDHEFVIDLAKQFEAEVILVSRNYLGSINHTMLSIDYLKSNGFDIAGIIFNDTPNPETESFILNHSNLPCLGRIDAMPVIDKTSIQSQLQNITL